MFNSWRGCRIVSSSRYRLFAVDPTKTTQLRKRFVTTFNRRFKKLRSLIEESIVTNDCFGLAVPSPELLQEAHSSIGRQKFKFDTNEQKITAFGLWLARQVDIGIFQVINGKYWFNPYLLEGYSKGIAWATANVRKAEAAMRRAGVTPPPTLGLPVRQVISGKRHVDALRSIYTRAFTELKDITDDMDKAISLQLADGLMEGESPVKLARRLNNRVSKIGVYRATLLARTEIIRAHHVSTINRYEDLAVENVVVEAEWLGTEDGRMCSICSGHNGKVYSLDDVRDMIPVHPQCRCTTVAVFDF